MRIDYGYRKNGTREFVQTLNVTRSPRDYKEYAYTVKRIAGRIQSEFAVVTDVALQKENERHRFVLDTLNDAEIVPVPLEHFAVWVPKLKPMMQRIDSGDGRHVIADSEKYLSPSIASTYTNHDSPVTNHYTSGDDQFSSVSFTLCRNWCAMAPSTTRWS